MAVMGFINEVKKDKYLAVFLTILLFMGYLFVLQNEFMENACLFMLGVTGGLLKQAQSQPSVNVERSDETTTTVNEAKS